jgi:hypothetical protein
MSSATALGLSLCAISALVLRRRATPVLLHADGAAETRMQAKGCPLPGRRLSRSALLRSLAVPALAPQAARAVIGEVTGPGFFQADDKSWDVTLPPSWAPGSDTRAEPEHVFHLRAMRSSGGASLDVFVDKVKKGAKQLNELGKLEAVGQRYAASLQPNLQPASLQSAAEVSGIIRGSRYYQYAFATAGGGTARLKLGVQQNRVYALYVFLPAKSSAEVEAEAAGIVDSFKCFPVNIFCLGQSNSGTAPASGSCY